MNHISNEQNNNDPNSNEMNGRQYSYEHRGYGQSKAPQKYVRQYKDQPLYPPQPYSQPYSQNPAYPMGMPPGNQQYNGAPQYHGQPYGMPPVDHNYFEMQQNYVQQETDPFVIMQETAEAKRVVNIAGLALMALAIAVFAAQVVVEIPVNMFWPQLAETDWYVWALTAFSMVGVGFPVFYLCLRMVPDSPRREVSKLKISQFIMIFFISSSAMYITNILTTILTYGIAMLKGDTELINPAAEAILDGNFILTLIYVSIVAPIIEELIFRKLLLDKLRRFGDVPAILISGITFGLFHMNLSQMFYAAVLGFIFAYVTLRTNRIRYAIILHMMINFISTAISPFATEENIVAIMLITMWMLISVLLGIIFFIINVKKIKLVKEKQLFKKSVYFLNPGMLIYFIICIIMIILTTVLL